MNIEQELAESMGDIVDWYFFRIGSFDGIVKFPSRSTNIPLPYIRLCYFDTLRSDPKIYRVADGRFVWDLLKTIHFQVTTERRYK